MTYHRAYVACFLFLSLAARAASSDSCFVAFMIIIYIRLLRQSAVNVTLPVSREKNFVQCCCTARIRSNLFISNWNDYHLRTLKKYRICFIHGKPLFKKVKLTSESAIQDEDLTLSKYCHMLQTFHIQSDAQSRLFLVNIKSPHFYFISPKDTSKTAFGSLLLSSNYPPPPPPPPARLASNKNPKKVTYLLSFKHG